MKPLKTRWQQKWLRLDNVAPELQKLADEAEAFAGRWFKNDTRKSLLVIVGKFGTGKTHTAKSIFKFCSLASMAAFETKKWGEHKFPICTFLSWPEVANELAEKQFGAIDDAIEHELVILDDIGAENDPWKVCSDRLCQVLSKRERKFSVVTTNVSPENWTERFDGRINDRLLRNSVVVDISAVKSYAMR